LPLIRTGDNFITSLANTTELSVDTTVCTLLVFQAKMVKFGVPMRYMSTVTCTSYD